MAKHQNIALFVPHQGCPEDCVFCNQARITGQSRTEKLTSEKVKQVIEENLATLSKGDHIEIAFFGGSFTGLPRSYQRMLLETAQPFIQAGLVQGIRISTRPDYIRPAILDYLASYGVTTIELGTQSMLPDVLERSKRGHTVEETIQAVQWIKEQARFQLGLQLLPGLPGDTLSGSIYSAQEVAKLKPDFVRIYPTLVIKGTELEWDYALGKYQPMSLEEAVERVAQMCLIFQRANIPVIRMGLQPSEDLREEGTIVAGPFHPAFRQLVEGYLFEQLLQKIALAHPQLEQIWIHPADETAVRGQKGMRFKNFVHQLSRSVTLQMNKEVERGSINVSTELEQMTYSFVHLVDDGSEIDVFKTS